MLRSVLFTPGNSERMMEKALRVPADAVVFDLEDAVALSEKEAARGKIRQALTLPRRAKAYVRVNALSTQMTADDIEAVACGGLDGVVLPKVEKAADLHIVDWFMGVVERRKGLCPGSLDLVVIIENAKGVWNLEEILRASERLSRVSFGSVDYTTDLGIRWSGTGQELYYARMMVVCASRAAGKEPPLDTVYPVVHDLEGLRKEAELAKALGFKGKTAIHPEQIPVINEVFTPTQEEIEFAKKVVEAFKVAEGKGLASIVIDGGKFVDYPVYLNAKRVLEMVEEERATPGKL